MHNSRVAADRKTEWQSATLHRLHFYDAFYPKTRNIRVVIDYNALTLDPSDKSDLNCVFYINYINQDHVSDRAPLFSSPRITSPCFARAEKKKSQRSPEKNTRSIVIFPSDPSIFQFTVTNSLIPILAVERRAELCAFF